jgi:PPOX class probable F420-dependent enzyme
MTDWERDFITRHRVARLATASSQGQPHVVPIVYAWDGRRLFTPIDKKPKRVGAYQLGRARDIQANPNVAVIIDDYDEDWQRLAWVQIRGRAIILAHGEAYETGLELLSRKYPQYEDMPLTGRPLIAISLDRVVSWRAA